MQNYKSVLFTRFFVRNPKFAKIIRGNSRKNKRNYNTVLFVTFFTEFWNREIIRGKSRKNKRNNISDLISTFFAQNFRIAK